MKVKLHDKTTFTRKRIVTLSVYTAVITAFIIALPHLICAAVNTYADICDAAFDPIIVRLNPYEHYCPPDKIPYETKEDAILYLKGYTAGWLVRAEGSSATFYAGGKRGSSLSMSTCCFQPDSYVRGHQDGGDAASRELDILVKEAEKKLEK